MTPRPRQVRRLVLLAAVCLTLVGLTVGWRVGGDRWVTIATLASLSFLVLILAADAVGATRQPPLSRAMVAQAAHQLARAVLDLEARERVRLLADPEVRRPSGISVVPLEPVWRPAGLSDDQPRDQFVPRMTMEDVGPVFRRHGSARLGWSSLARAEAARRFLRTSCCSIWPVCVRTRRMREFRSG